MNKENELNVKVREERQRNMESLTKCYYEEKAAIVKCEDEDAYDKADINRLAHDIADMTAKYEAETDADEKIEIGLSIEFCVATIAKILCDIKERRAKIQMHADNVIFLESRIADFEEWYATTAS